MPTVMIFPEAYINTDAPYVKMFEEAGFEIRFPDDPTFTRGLYGEDETIKQMEGMDATVAGGEHYTPRVLESLPQLKVIARAGVGFDRVNVEAASARQIAVTITPTTNHESVAELTLALLFAVTKRIVLNDRAVRAGGWPTDLLMPIRGQTFGILGLGRIGRSTATRARALGMEVLACEKYPQQDFVDEHGIELVDFGELLERSDIVSIHCPLNDETEGMMNRDAFARMKTRSILLNTARGGVVAESDLLEALQNGTIYAAGLDVFEVEPSSADNPLFQLDNVVVSPHKAGTDEKSSEEMGVEAADCVIKLYRGEWPEGAVVNDQLRDGWSWER
jgi:D-3-phosphoglycerate dehydrogenase